MKLIDSFVWYGLNPYIYTIMALFLLTMKQLNTGL